MFSRLLFFFYSTKWFCVRHSVVCLSPMGKLSACFCILLSQNKIRGVTENICYHIDLETNLQGKNSRNGITLSRIATLFFNKDRLIHKGLCKATCHIHTCRFCFVLFLISPTNRKCCETWTKSNLTSFNFDFSYLRIAVFTYI